MAEPKVRLRPLERGDADLVFAWRNTPEVAGWSFTGRAVTAEEHAAWIERVVDASDSRHWLILLDKRPVGLVYLREIDDRHGTCHWGFYIGEPEARGIGVATAGLDQALAWVFDERRLRKVNAEVVATNEAGLRTHRRLGFVEEGLQHQQAVHSDGPVDLVLFGLLEDDWRNR